MMSFIMAILPVALQIVGFFIQRAALKSKAKQDYFKFVELASTDLGSVKLRKYGAEQLKELEKKPWVETTI